MSVPIIYLDNNATTQCAPEVIEMMLPFFAGKHGNASSPHLLGRQASLAVASARECIAESVGCNASEICFTSCATEANNLSILGVAQAHSTRRKIVASAIEHKSVLGPCAALEERGFEFEIIPVKEDGLIDLEAARCIIDERTLLVSVQGANNEIGTIQPVNAVAELAHERGAAFHCDAAQLLGKIPVSVNDMGADFVSFSSHKAYGPKGIGFLVVRNRMRSVALSPLFFGGGQEHGLRPGTLNVPAIVGTGEACRLSKSLLMSDMDRIASLRLSLEEGIHRHLPEAVVIASGSQRLPGTTSIMFSSISGDLLIARTPTVCMSIGSACTSGSVAPSHVLLALGLPIDRASSVVRLSLGRYTTAHEVRAAVSAISQAIDTIKGISTAAKGNNNPNREVAKEIIQ